MTYKKLCSKSRNSAAIFRQILSLTMLAIATLSLASNALAQVETLEIISGNNQTAEAGTRYAENLKVLVKDVAGNPISGVILTFTAPVNSSSPGVTRNLTVAPSDSVGIAQGIRPFANDIAGAFQIVASIDGKSVTFNLENTPLIETPREIELSSDSPNNLTNGGVFAYRTLQPGETLSSNFYINNLGTEVLTLGPNAVQLSGPDVSNFTFTRELNATTVAGRSRESFVLLYTPSGTGVKTALITINNDDEDESPYTFTVTAETLAPSSPPELTVQNGTNLIENGDNTPSELEQTSFGDVVVGDTLFQREFFLRNTGGDLLSVDAINFMGANASDFSVFSATSLNVPLDAIPPLRRHEFSIVFTPSGVGLRTATVSIPSNDTDNTPYIFDISGYGTAQLSVNSGDNQTTIAPQTFSDRLTVRVIGDNQSPVAGVRVNFSAPNSGASAALSPLFAVTDSNGLASVAAIANNTIGSYAVTASSTFTNKVSFNLRNAADEDGDGIPDPVSLGYIPSIHYLLLLDE